MAVLRPDRFMTGAVGTSKTITAHTPLTAAFKGAYTGLIDVQLANAGDQGWTGARCWDVLASRQAAVAGAPAILRRGRRSRSPRSSLTAPWASSGLRLAAAMDHEVSGPATQVRSESMPNWARTTVSTVLEPGQPLVIVKTLAYGWSSLRSVPAL